MIIFLKKYQYILIAVLFALFMLFVIVSLFSVDNATNNTIVTFIETYGWKIDKNPKSISHIVIPREFDAVYNTYNSIQLKSGFDISKYKGKTVSRYSYKLLNHKKGNNCIVSVNILLANKKIIAADISSDETEGFIHPITDTSYIIK